MRPAGCPAASCRRSGPRWGPAAWLARPSATGVSAGTRPMATSWTWIGCWTTLRPPRRHLRRPATHARRTRAGRPSRCSCSFTAWKARRAATMPKPWPTGRARRAWPWPCRTFAAARARSTARRVRTTVAISPRSAGCCSAFTPRSRRAAAARCWPSAFHWAGTRCCAGPAKRGLRPRAPCRPWLACARRWTWPPAATPSAGASTGRCTPACSCAR